MSRKLISRDPTTELPIKDIRKRMKERPRERVLSPDELARLWHTLEADAGCVYSGIYRLAFLTAQRLGEVAGMRWADLDLARGEWRQPTNKSDRPHVVPLSAAALAIIQARPLRQGPVFTTSAGGTLDRRTGNWTRATTRYAEISGTAGWTPHDLRRTGATILAEAKVAPVVIEQLLNHAEAAGKGSAVAGIYNRHSYTLEKRQAVEKLAAHVQALADGEAGEVIAIRPAKAG
jgi:integrase